MLSKRQQEIYDFVVSYAAKHGYPPTVREIGEEVGLASPSTVHAHLANLERAGMLRRDPTKPRALEVVGRDRASGSHPVRAAAPDPRRLPLVGEIAAGGPLLAEENIEDYLAVPEPLTAGGDEFLLRVKGESMIDAGILDGDFVVVRQQETADPGDTVVAGIPGEEATVKTFLRRRAKVVLRPENAAMDEMVFEPTEITIYGKVVSLLRRF